MQELAQLLRMEPAELALSMEQIQVTSMDAPLPDGRSLQELLPDRDDWMNRLLLRDAVSHLSREDQRLLLLRLRLGKTQAETARAMGISQVQVSRREAAVKQRLRRAWTEEDIT